MDLSLVVVAVIGLGGPTFIYFQNKQNNKRLEKNDANVMAIEKEKLDGLVMDRSKALYDGMINQLEAQVTKLRQTIDYLEKDLEEERGENTKLRQRIRELEDQADNLDEEIYQLKVKLTRLLETK